MRLAVATSVVASVDAVPAAGTMSALGLAWAAVRLASIDAQRRTGAVVRVICGLTLGIVLASPLFLPRLLTQALRTDISWSYPAWFVAWHPVHQPNIDASLVALLLTTGLACLAFSPGARHGRSLRLLLAGALICITTGSICGVLEARDARPAFLNCLIMLCATSINDFGAGQQHVSRPIMIALVLLPAAVAITALERFPVGLAFANGSALAVGLVLTGRTKRAAALSVPAIASAAWTALFFRP